MNWTPFLSFSSFLTVLNQLNLSGEERKKGAHFLNPQRIHVQPVHSLLRSLWQSDLHHGYQIHGFLSHFALLVFPPMVLTMKRAEVEVPSWLSNIWQNYDFLHCRGWIQCIWNSAALWYFISIEGAFFFYQWFMSSEIILYWSIIRSSTSFPSKNVCVENVIWSHYTCANFINLLFLIMVRDLHILKGCTVLLL